MIESASYRLNEIYVDYLNNYLTIEKFAEHNGLTKEHAASVLNAGRYVHEGNHPDL